MTKSAKIYIFDFTKTDCWNDDGNMLLLNGKHIVDGYFDHLFGEEVEVPEIAAYIEDDPGNGHVVTSTVLEGWVEQPDGCNNTHWYQCAYDYITSISDERMNELLNGQLYTAIEVPLNDFGYIDYESDPKISAELDEMRDEKPKGFNYDTETVTEAFNRAYPSKVS